MSDKRVIELLIAETLILSINKSMLISLPSSKVDLFDNFIYSIFIIFFPISSVQSLQ